MTASFAMTASFETAASFVPAAAASGAARRLLMRLPGRWCRRGSSRGLFDQDKRASDGKKPDVRPSLLKLGEVLPCKVRRTPFHAPLYQMKSAMPPGPRWAFDSRRAADHYTIARAGSPFILPSPLAFAAWTSTILSCQGPVCLRTIVSGPGAPTHHQAVTAEPTYSCLSDRQFGNLHRFSQKYREFRAPPAAILRLWRKNSGNRLLIWAGASFPGFRDFLWQGSGEDGTIRRG